MANELIRTILPTAVLRMIAFERIVNRVDSEKDNHKKLSGRSFYGF